MTSYNRTVNRLRASGLYDYVPLNTSFAEEKRRLDEYGGGAKALNQRIAQLRRILKSVRKDAWDVVQMPDGGTAPKYLRREMQYARRTVNARRRALKYSLYPDFDQMTKPQQYTLLADKNLTEYEDWLSSGEDLSTLLEEEYLSDRLYMNNYIATMEGLPEWDAYRSKLKAQIERILQVRGALVWIMEGKFDEATIEYIYPSSAYQEPFSSRQRKVLAFWDEMEEKWVR